MFVFLEVAALSGYALIGVAGGKALVSAFRYLILGTLGASLYLLGVGYFYAATGTLNMADLAQRVPALVTSKAIVGGLIFMFLGLAIKMAPHAASRMVARCLYARAGSRFTAPRLSCHQGGVDRLGSDHVRGVGPETEIEHVPVLTLLEELGAIAAVVGALLALTQRELKRMFAYGGISHIGLILIGVGLGNATGFAGGVFYLINDAVMQAALFFWRVPSCISMAPGLLMSWGVCADKPHG